jgi:hypothetical protein
MKTLNKLNINLNNILNNDDLKSLNGGTQWCGICGVWDGGSLVLYGQSCGTSQAGADATCTSFYQAILGPNISCTCGAA